MDRQHQKPKRSRKSAPKSRQGCITCKARHVKCDEARPYCKRCIKAGRKCAGYPELEDSAQDETGDDERQSSSAVDEIASEDVSEPAKAESISTVVQENETALLTYQSPSRVPDLGSFSPTEARFLEYFYTRTAPSISGFFDANFYNRLLLQAGLGEPAIRHSMMAVGAMHEHFETALVPALDKRRVGVSGEERSTFALQQYNKAISAISRQMSSGPGSMDSVLMCCLLFACLECLRGDSAAAMRHLKSGAGIIENIANGRKRVASTEHSSSTPSSSNSTKGSDFIETHLVPIFERLNTHVDAAHLTQFELRDLINPNIYHENPQEIGFQTLDDARQSIMYLGSLVSKFVRSVGMTKYVQGPTEAQVRVQAGLLRRLQLWDESMNALLENQQHDKGLTRRAVVLQTQHKCFNVFALNGLAVEQCVNDCFTKFFEDGVYLAELVLDHSESGLPAKDDEQDLHVFSLEEGVAPALFIFATRCRIPNLRRRAIAAMNKGPRRQGIWNAFLMSKVAERVVELEENFEVLPATATATGDSALKANINVDSVDMPLTPESFEGVQAELDTSDTTDTRPTFSPSDDSIRLPSENARIHHIDLKEAINGSPHEHNVTFFRKPNGIHKVWEIWTEKITI